MFDFLRKFIVITKRPPYKALLIILILSLDHKWIKQAIFSYNDNSPEKAINEVWRIFIESLNAKKQILTITTPLGIQKYQFISLAGYPQIPIDYQEKMRFI